MGTEARRFAFNYPRKYPHQCPQYPQNPERAKKNPPFGGTRLSKKPAGSPVPSITGVAGYPNG
ncbi:MAG: hypothetical protein LOD87_14715, partial [Planifilum fulgidum]